ncbi:aminotransferase class I/II-fold pyridoxal phosphate-dependent enzyme [Burkholderia ubonensis]|uniref:aminotransferase class I/II-fold pyridoxal phosphate-dependent enzyme n=1 Tax=Burkholderia ubonensis TaxID=101571 RepID=UPI002ABDFB2A|nr:aminotransferase class I/II-fold pyridoxal phosphate-dependent enzyme [Burkholderia ubonensis]
MPNMNLMDEKIQRTGLQSTIIDCLEFHRVQSPHRPLFSFVNDNEETTVSFAGLASRVDSIAAHLAAIANRGSRVLLVFQPGLEFIASFFACLRAGMIAVPTYPPGKNARSFAPIAGMMADCRPAVILTAECMRSTLASHLDSAGANADPKVVSSDAIPTTLQPEFEPGMLDADDIALIQYTSGSTGTPKGVVITHANLMHNSGSIRDRFGHDQSSRGVIWLPPFHDMGLIGGIVQPVFVGFHTMLMPPMSFVQKPLRWLQAISDCHATTSGGPNFAYDLCVRKIQDADLDRLDLSSWEVAFNGAEPVSADVIDRFADRFARCGFRKEAFYACYGMAETTLIVTGGIKGRGPSSTVVDARELASHRVVPAEPGDASQRLVACGVPTDDHAIEIVHPETLARLPRNEVGEIWVSGPSVARGYWAQPERTAETFASTIAQTTSPKWLRTGDLGFVDDDGQIFIAGRRKDLIIIRGRNYHPQDIETTVGDAHPALRPGAGAAFSVSILDEERLVVVHEVKREYLRADLSDVVDAIRRSVTQRHELQVCAVALVKPAGLPVTTSGKIRRHACRAAFVDRTLPCVSEWALDLTSVQRDAAPRPIPKPDTNDGAADAILVWLKEAIASAVHVASDDVDVNALFADHGLDSLQIATLTGELSDWLECPVRAEVFSEPATITSVSRYLGAMMHCSSALALLSEDERREMLDLLSNGRAPRDLFDGADIPSACSRFEESAAYVEFAQRQQVLFKDQEKLPFFTVHEGLNNDRTVIGGRDYINFSCNNFLSLSGHPVVTERSIDAIRQYGTSVSASRLVSGERPLHLELEQAIADWIGVESALVFVGAATANVSTVGHLLGPKDLILYDELSHNSLLQGIKLSHADSQPFRHNDFDDLDRILSNRRRQYERVLVFIEGLYSMDGDIPDLPRFIEIKKKHKTWLMVDECLSIGVIGETGRGIGEFHAVDRDDVDIWMGGLSKAFASCGGYIAGRKSLIGYLKFTTPGFIYTTGISPANAAAALAALRLLKDDPSPIRQLRERVDQFLELTARAGLNTGNCHGGPIVPVIIGNQIECIRLYQILFANGINVQPIIFPAVAANAARLRFSFNATHTGEQVRQTVRVLADALGALRAAGGETIANGDVA